MILPPPKEDSILKEIDVTSMIDDLNRSSFIHIINNK